MHQFTSLPPLSLYIHFPWCVRKCPYCDFNSHELKDELAEDKYIEAIIADLDQELPLVWGRPVHSVFMGGGTPSLFSPAALEKLLSALRARLNLSPQTEITLEANPGTIEQQRFTDYHAIGINRLSIGVQSFAAQQLERLGRIHSTAEATRAIEAAHTAGFTNFNIDLMYALPQQSTAEALQDLRTAISLAPQHISYYQLTIEPNTYFQHKTPPLPDDDTTYEIEIQAHALLAEHGYQRYEISAFAQPGHSCRHNLNYWQFGDYLGIGAGAHAKLSDAQQQRILRRWKVKHPRDYLAGAVSAKRIAGETTLTIADTCFEFMLNALRLCNGFDSELFSTHTGLAISHVTKQLQEAEQRGLLHWDLRHITPSANGLRYLNDLLGLFVTNNDTTT